MKRGNLPERPEEMSGLRAARWVRESTAGQADKQGPAAQRRMQDDAIDEFALIDTGLSWMVLKSGWSGSDSMKQPPATQTPDFRAMVAAAEEGLFDVLLIGYTSRYLRDLTLALHYRRHFQRHGVVLWICDDRLLSSNPRDWERLVDKLKAAEVYSRDHSRNVRSGYAEKRRNVGDPGGQPGLGFRRVDSLLEIDLSGMAVVRRMFELAAAGRTDLEVADATGKSVDTVRHVLRNPIYIGKLQDGTDFRLGAAIDIGTWNDVQAKRDARKTREPGRVVMRSYALKVRCASCKVVLHGDMERYRHPLPVCAEYPVARPAIVPVRGRHSTTEWKSYRQDWYEAIPGALLSSLASTPTELVAAVLAALDAPDPVTKNDQVLARIARQMDEASQRLTKTRDVVEWQKTMARLDAEKAATLAAAPDDTPADPAKIADYLRDLGQVWRSADPRSRQELAMALWDGWEFLGFKEATYVWSVTARRYGLDRLVPQTVTIDLSALDLPGKPKGDVVLYAKGPR